MRSLLTLLLVLLFVPSTLPAQEAAQGAEPAPKEWRTHHSIRVAGETIEYDAVLGSIILRDAQQNPTGQMYYTAYFRSGIPDSSHRPIMFSYNGGPGSSSFWLHMGVMGPHDKPDRDLHCGTFRGIIKIYPAFRHRSHQNRTLLNVHFFNKRVFFGMEIQSPVGCRNLRFSVIEIS